MKLSSQVALVTGASGGIGSAICRALAAEGAAIALHYHQRAEAAAQLRDSLARDGTRVHLIPADLRADDAIPALVEEVRRAFGRLDILVNNAGWTRVVAPEKLEDLTDELIDQTFRLKVHAPLKLIRAAAPLLRASGSGSIVNITSVAGIAARGSSIPYAAANAALSTLTRSLARTLAPSIRVNAVAPGFVDTGFAFPTDGTTARQVAANNHLGRCTTPDDVAAAVRFLCADAPVITGEEIVVDAGIGRLGKR